MSSFSASPSHDVGCLQVGEKVVRLAVELYRRGGLTIGCPYFPENDRIGPNAKVLFPALPGLFSFGSCLLPSI
jgi:hypothetical protein